MRVGPVFVLAAVLLAPYALEAWRGNLTTSPLARYSAGSAVVLFAVATVLQAGAQLLRGRRARREQQ